MRFVTLLSSAVFALGLATAANADLLCDLAAEGEKPEAVVVADASDLVAGVNDLAVDVVAGDEKPEAVVVADASDVVAGVNDLAVDVVAGDEKPEAALC